MIKPDYSDKHVCKRLCDLTHEYLHWIIYRVCNDHEFTEDVLKPYMKPKLEIGQLSISELYVHFLGHVQNTSQGGNGMRKIFGSPWKDHERHEQWHKLAKLTNNFDVNFVTEKYPVFKEFRKKIFNEYQPKNNKFTGPAERFIISVFEIGHFLGQNELFPNSKAFYDYINIQYHNDRTQLIKHLNGLRGKHKKALAGLSHALLRDALKELGYVRYVKPDIHIKDIAILLNIADASDSGTKIAEAVEEVANKGGITPFHLDKFFFLIGSGELYLKDQLFIRNQLKRENSITRKESLKQYIFERLQIPELKVGDSVALLVNYPNLNLLRGEIGGIVSQQSEKTRLVKVKFNKVNDTLSLYPTEFVVLHGNN